MVDRGIVGLHVRLEDEAIPGKLLQRPERSALGKLSPDGDYIVFVGAFPNPTTFRELRFQDSVARSSPSAVQLPQVISASLMIDQTVSHYKISEKLGEGGRSTASGFLSPSRSEALPIRQSVWCRTGTKSSATASRTKSTTRGGSSVTANGRLPVNLHGGNHEATGF